MRKLFYLLAFFCTSFYYAQTNGITYQAVIYLPNGQNIPGQDIQNSPMTNRLVCLQFSLIDDLSQLEYQETIQTTTDEFGMVNLLIGSGTQTGGYASSFNAVLWNNTRKSLKVELDALGNCQEYIVLSDNPLSAVPFAYAAVTANNVSGTVAILNGGTGASNLAGAKINLQIDNVDNTSDAAKPISTATQTALDAKEALTNKSSSPTLGTSDVFYPTQNAVKTYVDNQVTNATIPDADAITKGKIQLAGDLSGTAAAPTVPGLANKENSANKSTATTLGTSDQLFPTQNAVKTYVDTNITSVNATITSLQGTITANATAATTAIALVQADVDANEITSNAADVTLQDNINTLQNTVTTNASNTTSNLALKENASNKSTVTTLGTSDDLFPTQNAVKTYVDAQVASATIADADAITKGKIQLAGDLSGTAAAPTVPALATKENAANKSTVTTLGTSDDLFPTQNAVKTYVDTNISTVNANNTALQAIVTANANAANNAIAIVQADVDANETAANTALALKENSANKSTTTTLGTSDQLFPTQNAVKTYVDAQVASATIADADAITKGKIQLAGDLSGTAALPRVPGLTLKENAANKSTVTTLGTSDDLFPTQNAVKTYVDTNISTVNANNAALQATVTANATSATNSIAAVQTDLDANETASNLADTALQTNINTLNSTVTSNSAATTTALGLKEDSINKSNTTTLGTSDDLFPTQNAVKTYVDTNISTVNANNAALQATVTANATAATNAIAAVQTDVDANETAANTALALKEDADNKTLDLTTVDGTSDIKFPSAKATKDYVDLQISTGVVDASTTVKGKIQLAGDLGGTAALPEVATGAITTVKLADDSVSTIKIIDAAVTDIKLATGIDATKLADGSVTNTELQYIGTITSNVQTQINGLNSDIATNTSNIATNTTNIATNATNIATNTTAIATNTTDIAANTAAIATNTTNIATNTTDIATNTASIATNTTDIAANTTAIATNTTDIAANTAAIATNTTDIAANTTAIATNTTDIATNTAAIATNTTNIAANTTAIATNTTDIATNTAAIATNTTDIAANTTAIATNTTDIATNTTAIATNTTDIATNATNIAANTTAIATNTTDIATNASNITANTTAIATNTTDIATNASNITANTAAIATNTTDIAANTAAINTNTTDIATNTAAITTNTTDIAINTTDIATNTAAIATNTTDIATNASNITANTAAIATNTTDITTNATNITANTTAIATNTTNIATNTTDIATNTAAIANNTTDIATNATNIAANTTAIATNTTDIATNTTDIATNTAAIANNTTDIATLKTLESGKIYVGNASNEATQVRPAGDVTITNTGVTTIANDAVTTAKITDANVTSAKLADDAVETAKIKNANVTYAKIQNVSATDKVLGRVSTGAGVIEEISTTGSGNVVRATSPTLVTPDLGVPSAIDLTYATGLPIDTAVTGILDVANGGTGSATKNFVDLTENQTIDGVKTFSGSSTVVNQNLTVNAAGTSGKGIILSDDGDIVDNNDGAATFRFTGGVRINNDKGVDGTTTNITLSNTGNISASGSVTASQLTSNVATGTAPLVVTSTTPVANLNIGGNAANVTGTVAIANGGTGQTTKTAAFDALSPMTASGDIIYGGTSGTGTRLAKGTDGQVLTLASGLPSWVAPTGVTTMAAIGSTPNANGATISGVNLNLQPASASFGGVVTTGTQAFAGDKTFNSDITVNENKFGRGAGSTGSRNIAIGINPLNSNTTGTWNTAVGAYALESNTTSSNNTAIGNNALKNATGSSNTAVGSNSLLNSTTGFDNTAIGKDALKSNTTGYSNIGIGVLAGANTTSGYENISIGKQALQQNTTGYTNVAIGTGAIDFITTGNNNTVLGGFAGRYAGSGTINTTTLNNSMLLGYDTRPKLNNDSNEIVIGNSTVGNGSNTTTLGNASTTDTYIYGNLNITGQLKVNNSVLSKSTAYAFQTSDNANLLVFTGSTAGQTITLPSASSAGAGREITIKNIASVSVGINAAGGNLISDSTTTGATLLSIGIEPSNNWIKAISDGTNWIILRALF